VALTNGPLNHMLRNRMYLGELNHRESSYPGEHAPIVDPTLFHAVQAKLTRNLHQRRSSRSHSDVLLMGRLYDDRDNRMSPTYAVKTGLRYRYYVSTMLVQGRRSEAGSVPRVPASELEGVVLEAIATTASRNSDQDVTDRERVEQIVERVIVPEGLGGDPSHRGGYTTRHRPFDGDPLGAPTHAAQARDNRADKPRGHRSADPGCGSLQAAARHRQEPMLARRDHEGVRS